MALPLLQMMCWCACCCLQVGFRHAEIKRRQLLHNNQPVMMKGAREQTPPPPQQQQQLPHGHLPNCRAWPHQLTVTGQ